jgi:hypothetical protein
MLRLGIKSCSHADPSINMIAQDSLTVVDNGQCASGANVLILKKCKQAILRPMFVCVPGLQFRRDSGHRVSLRLAGRIGGA